MQFGGFSGKLAIFIGLLSFAGSGEVWGYSGGISGFSGNPAVNGGSKCINCHFGGIAPTVSLIGPTTVAPGSVSNYVLRISGGQNKAGGLDVSTSGGMLAATDAGTRLLGGEITHNSPRNATIGVVDFGFSWQAPSAAGVATLYASGNSVDLSGSPSGDLSSSAQLVITVQAANQPPVADAGGPYAGAPGAVIQLSGGLSKDPDGSIVAYDWNFGDQAIASGVNPTHVYPSAGTYVVTLRVTDNQGASSQASTQATISQPANQPPIARAGGPYAATVAQAIAFNGSGSSDPDGSIVSYQWDFGDGAQGSGPAPSHAYALAGTYSAMLMVTDNSGATAQAVVSVTITQAQGPNQLPTANPGGPYSSVHKRRIVFDGSGSFDPDGTIASYVWDFGDGTTGSGVRIAHRYATTGTYTVVLTVTDDRGGVAQATTTAKVGK